MIRVGARLGGHTDLPELAAQFGGVHAGLDLELLQGINRRQENVRIEVDVGVVRAVEREVVPFTPTAADGNLLLRPIAALARARRTHRPGRKARRHVRRQLTILSCVR